MLVERFGARVFSGAWKKGSLKNFSARVFFVLILSRGKRMFASGRDVCFVGASAGSGDGSMDGLVDVSGGKRSFASGRNESIRSGAEVGSFA